MLNKNILHSTLFGWRENWLVAKTTTQLTKEKRSHMLCRLCRNKNQI